MLQKCSWGRGEGVVEEGRYFQSKETRRWDLADAEKELLPFSLAVYYVSIVRSAY